ncbi:helix-turn-helix transcriptional regulator [Sphingomonas sp. BIUV-7]|uniref:Helix-turn-helix transcriptional regulator n=1 Tax=Sphingomonas natans TaxID=3063330 RepID=A0ABT8YEZ2_9SPHN|nr:helix-turn-helix transcriptional regulator [Sphingomonas sp. BIUV-7]MDO6416145.1 helix-turn-helix transcriptional regulator [Sphingomonas sp. BIUV-7]
MAADRFDLLSDRELEVLRLSAMGLKPKMIAVRLSLSERTVYAHLANAARKLGVSPGEAAMALARREALGPYAKLTKQSLPVAPEVPFLVDLLIPELSRRRFNDLNLSHRIVVIVTRCLLVSLIMFALTGVVRDIGQIVGRHG